MHLNRIVFVALLVVFALPGIAEPQLVPPKVPTDAQVQPEIGKNNAAMTQDAAKASGEAKGSAEAVKAQGQAAADKSKGAAGSQVDAVKTKAKTTGKKGVQTGATKAKPVVGEAAAGTAGAVATEKGNAGVDKGVDKAADKVEGMLK